MTAPNLPGAPGGPGAPDGGLSYATAGVDIAAGERAVDLIRAAVARTARTEVVGGIGGFAGLFDASRLAAYRRPLLATATDGVGTKVTIAQQLGVYDTVGIDLVAMVVDDLAVCGAEPLFLTDYVVCGRVRPERAAAIVGGVDATQDSLASMKAGDLKVTVFQDAAGQGKGAVDAALALAAGKPVEKKVYIPFQLVTPANMDQFMKKN